MHDSTHARLVARIGVLCVITVFLATCLITGEPQKASRLAMTDLLESAAMKGASIPTSVDSSGVASSGSSSSGERVERLQSAPSCDAATEQVSSAAPVAPVMVEEVPQDGVTTPIP